MSTDDTITLGGQVFAVKGLIRGNATSEFETGIKIGKASYDQREHAFFLVLDDFSGGFAHRRLDIREELGTFWDVDPANAPDLRRAGHITLHTSQSNLAAPTAPASNNMTVRAPSFPYMRSLGGVNQLLGFGSSIYRSTDGSAWTRAFAGGADAGQCQAIVGTMRPHAPGATELHYAFFSSIAGATTGTARYIKSTNNGATWANGESDKVLHDAIYWDNKVIAVWGTGIIFGIVDAADNIAWNIDTAADAEFITTVPGGHAHFVGVATAPWGEPAVYFTDERRLFVLDFFARKSYPIDIGIGRNLSASCIWNSYVTLTDGWNVWLYSAGGETVRNIGFPRRDGIPDSIRDSTAEYLIGHLIPADNYLYAVVNGNNTTRLFCYNGIGWAQVGSQIPALYSNVGFIAYYPPSGAVTGRALTVAGATTPTTVDIKLTNFNLPNLHHIPVVGRDAFNASGGQWITGWIDGGFNDIDGTLLRLNIDALNLSASSTVRVEYQLDGNETGVWTQMVDVNNAVDVFDNATSVVYFSQATPKRGIKFRIVRFRFTLNRGGATDSPEVKAFTLVYLKTPEVRSAWTIQIDANRMIETSTTGSDTTYYIDGNPATMERIWAKLRSLWINSHTLAPFIIPNIEPSPGINVKITDIPMTFDDFRNAVDGLGYVDVQVLEPVPR